MADGYNAPTTPVITAASLAFPPYGVMPKEFADSMNALQPPAWKKNDQWAPWYGQVADILTALLWPEHLADGTWKGAAGGRMAALTDADFGLLDDLIELLDLSGPDGPRGAGASPAALRPIWLSAPKGSSLFKTEDVDDAVIMLPTGSVSTAVTEMLRPSRTLKDYLRGILDEPTIDALAAHYMAGIGNLGGAFPLDIKNRLQRPRPYQTAKLRNDTHFFTHLATSSCTPSMISGHSFQTGMGGIALSYLMTEHITDAAQQAAALAALKKHSVDVGDRRVMAGVHYPSDNLGSWIVALLLAPHVCPDLNGREFLGDAIVNDSLVFARIADIVGKDPGHVYAPAFAAVQLLATDPAADIADITDMIAHKPSA